MSQTLSALDDIIKVRNYKVFTFNLSLSHVDLGNGLQSLWGFSGLEWTDTSTG